MKKIKEQINGNAGLIQIGITIIGFLIMIVYFVWNIDGRIEKKICDNPRLERMEFNLKNIAREVGAEYID